MSIYDNRVGAWLLSPQGMTIIGLTLLVIGIYRAVGGDHVHAGVDLLLAGLNLGGALGVKSERDGS